MHLPLFGDDPCKEALSDNLKMYILLSFLFFHDWIGNGDIAQSISLEAIIGIGCL